MAMCDKIEYIPHYLHKILLFGLDTQFYEPAYQNSIKVPKVGEPTKKTVL